MGKSRHRREKAIFGIRAHASHTRKKVHQRKFAHLRRRRLDLAEQELDQEMRETE